MSEATWDAGTDCLVSVKLGQDEGIFLDFKKKLKFISLILPHVHTNVQRALKPHTKCICVYMQLY